MIRLTKMTKIAVLSVLVFSFGSVSALAQDRIQRDRTQLSQNADRGNGQNAEKRKKFQEMRQNRGTGGQGQGQGSRGGGQFDRDKIKKELMALPPEQRQQRIEQLKAQHKEKLSKKREKLQKKLQNATPEERQKFCARVQQKCQSEGKEMACKIASSQCGG